MSGAKKMFRDFRASWGRTLTLVLALALGTTVFTSTWGAYGVLGREMRRAYVETLPASATVKLEEVTSALLERARERTDIAAATRRGTLHGRFRRSPDGPWGNALIFIADNFEEMPIARLRTERGASSPKANDVLIERSALPILGGDLGTSFELSLPGGKPQAVAVSGVVHEAALAPADTHATIYVYATPALARTLGATTVFDELRILVARDSDNAAAVERTAQAVATWIAEQGLGRVHEIRVPPPGRHPHQSQMTTVLTLLVIFAGLVFFMSTLLAAALLNALLARQKREIGVLKTLGATNSTLNGWYFAAMTVLAGTAVGLAWVPARLGANVWTFAVSRMLNFDLEASAPGAWSSAIVVGATFLVPLLVALPSIGRATRVPVVSTLQDFGVTKQGARERGGIWESLAQRVSLESPALSYALRNVVRMRRKLALSVALFGVSGGVVIAAVSVADSWQAWSVRLRAEQVYDVEVTLADSAHLADARDRLTRLPSVAAVEPWQAAPTAWAVLGSFPVEHTYPDDAHGAFTLVAPPLDTAMLRVAVTEGRWLDPEDKRGVVLNQVVKGQAKIPVGAFVALAIEGTTHTFRVVGKIEQVGVGATAYVNAAALREIDPAGALGGRLRVKARGGREAAHLVADIEGALLGSHAKVVEITPLGVYENAMVAHFEILVRALFALAALTALVGTLGLGSTVAVGVLERTRELGVIRAMGGSGAQARNLVLIEGIIVGALSVILAIALGLMLAWGLGTVIGRMSFSLSLPLTPSVMAMGWWLLTAICLSALASGLPARRAARITVREAINHV